MIRPMSYLHHTQILRPSLLASSDGERNSFTKPDPTVVEAEAPHLVSEPEARWYADGLWESLVPSEATGGKLSVFQTTMPEGFSPPRHIHTREDEALLVLDGEAWFDIDGEVRLAGPGTSLYMPRGVPHTFRVKSPVARTIGVIVPGAFEQLFRSLSVPAGARTLPAPGSVPFDVAAVMELQIRLGTQIVGPPMAAVEL
jgi:quercetin dioxygenase-like cupin family protein